MDFTVSKQNTVTKIKEQVKAKINEFIFNALVEEYGEENVAFVRTGNTTKVNEIGFIVGTVDNEGDVNPITVTLNPTVKEFAARQTAKKTYEPFDFVAAREAYQTYIKEKAEKEADAAEKKAKKIASDQAAREKKAKEQEA